MLALPNHVQIPGLDKEGLLAYLAEQPDVVAAYLFGSHAEGRARPESDIDIAVLLTERPAGDTTDDVMARFDRRMELEGEIGRYISGRKFDLVVLNRAPVLLQHQVLANGYLLYQGNVGKRVDFEVRTSKLYLDLQPLQDFFDKALFQDIREGRFGERKRHYQRAIASAGR